MFQLIAVKREQVQIPWALWELRNLQAVVKAHWEIMMFGDNIIKMGKLASRSKSFHLNVLPSSHRHYNSQVSYMSKIIILGLNQTIFSLLILTKITEAVSRKVCGLPCSGTQGEKLDQ